MKIKVNKNQQEINFKTHVGTIITIAKQVAKSGCNTFNYIVPQNQGLNIYSLIEQVKKKTDGSVYVGPKCLSGSKIEFSICSD